MALVPGGGLLAQGMLVYVDYDAGGGVGYNEYHERLVIAHIQGDEYLVASPTFDLFFEQLSAGNADIADMRLGGLNGEVPIGLCADLIFGFGVINRVQRNGLLLEGERMAVLERAHRGIGAVAVGGIGAAAVAVPVPAALPPAVLAGVALAAPAVGGPPAGAPPVGLRGGLKRLVPPGGCWVLDEPTADFDIGDVFVLPAGAAQLGGRALVVIGREVCVLKKLLEGADIVECSRARSDMLYLDKRTVPLPFRGEVEPTFGQLVGQMDAFPLGVEYENPLVGPPTVDWALRAVGTQGGDLLSRHQRWRSESGVKGSNPIVHEHHLLSMMLQYAVCYDRLNLKGLLCMELAWRRLQLHESAVSENPEFPSYEGARHFMGIQQRRASALIAPSFSAHVAQELSKEAAIMKEKRKARESRVANPKKGGGKGAAASSHE